MPSYLITGSSRGLGLELATQLAAKGNIVFASARSAPPPALQKLIDGSSGRVAYVKLDAEHEESVKAAAGEVEKHLDGKGLDVLINNVGIMSYAPDGIAKMTNLNEAFNANVLSAHYVTSAFIPLLKKGTEKKVVNISTTLGSMTLSPTYAAMPVPAYKITKAALNMLTVQYAHEYANEGFTFLAVSPGWLRTDLGGKDIADLSVAEGAKCTLDVVNEKGPKDTGKFCNIFVEGWEQPPEGKFNYYDGKSSPW